MNDLINKGYVVRSFLGIYMQDINEDLYETLELQTRNGAIVSDIVEGSPASKSGLVEGDVIVSFEGKEISNCLLYTSPSPRDVEESRMPSSA